LLNGPLSFINKKLSQIDTYISAKQFTKALYLIDEVLEWMPGWEIGERMPQTGGIFWKKLLAEAMCNSDVELLCNKGKLLQNFTAFHNAVKYANANEKPVYALIEEAEKLIGDYLAKALFDHELDEKRKTCVENRLNEYKKILSKLENIMQDNIATLEKLEKLINENFVDCEIVSREYVHALDKLLSYAKNISNYNKNIISKEEKKYFEAQLDDIILESDNELRNFKKLEATQLETAHWRFLEYSHSINDKKSIINEIRLNMDALGKLRSEAEQLVSSIEKIVNEYAAAREAVYNGNYAPALRLLSQAQFDGIIGQAMSASICI